MVPNGDARHTELFVVGTCLQLKSHATLFESNPDDDNGDGNDNDNGGEEEEGEVPQMDTYSAGLWLVAVTVVTAFAADVLVGSIDETATKWGLPKR